MKQGHHGANHPVKDSTTGKVEIISMNHGFAVDAARFPAQGVERPSLAVRRLQQPASPQRPAGAPSSTIRKLRTGPQDSHYLFHGSSR